MTLHDIIEQLRAAPVDLGLRPSFAQLRLLVDDIWAMVPLWQTGARPEFSELSEADLLVLAETLGKFRARSLKGGLLGKRVRDDAFTNGVLLPPVEAEVAQAREMIASGRHPYCNTASGRLMHNPRWPRYMRAAGDIALTGKGVLPAGYDREEEHGRDVHLSLASVLAAPVPDEELHRFRQRTYDVRPIDATADHVLALHWLWEHDRADLLLQLIDKDRVRDYNPRLARCFVAAYDLLEVNRADAMKGLGRVVRQVVTTPADIHQNLVAAQWLAPGPIGSVIETAEKAIAHPESERWSRLLTTAVTHLRQHVANAPREFVVEQVAQMRTAHVHQVLNLSGMFVDRKEERTAIAELRTQLLDLDLEADLDRELPRALAAWRDGTLAQYYQDLRTRKAHDPEWLALYAEATLVGV